MVCDGSPVSCAESYEVHSWDTDDQTALIFVQRSLTQHTKKLIKLGRASGPGASVKLIQNRTGDDLVFCHFLI